MSNDTVPKTQKPGWKTSEFWLSLATTGLGVLTTLGILTPASPVAVVAGAALSVLPGLLYTHQRTQLKIAAYAGPGQTADAEDPK